MPTTAAATAIFPMSGAAAANLRNQALSRQKPCLAHTAEVFVAPAAMALSNPPAALPTRVAASGIPLMVRVCSAVLTSAPAVDVRGFRLFDLGKQKKGLRSIKASMLAI